jgi:hypothetical protein
VENEQQENIYFTEATLKSPPSNPEESRSKTLQGSSLKKRLYLILTNG